ncbi:10664_t:CDS:2 [Entrophospora sp. SA101]|nr:7254_t:CDS:2 [Entrophospora sp. SA101]CAJ0882509.1 10664_t:CDS:2 [Entrophospora sp. SA101]
MGEENELAQAYRQAYADNSPFLKEAKEKENIRELQGRHPGLVISNNEQNKHSPLITILPITSLKEGDEPYPFQVASYFQSKNGVILVDQIRTIDRKRFGERVGEAIECQKPEKELPLGLCYFGFDCSLFSDDQTEKKSQKPSNQSTLPPFQPSILPTKPPVINCPPARIIARNDQSTTPIMPLNTPEPVYHFPSAEFREISPDEQYRQTLLGLCEDWLESFNNPQQKSKVTQVISLLQVENKDQFILRNSPRIQGALKQKNQAGKVFHLRTDIANVYNCYYKAKNKQTWDLAEFLQELEEEETTKAKPASDPNMVYLPSAEQVELVREVYYTSSGGANLEVEKAQLQPFIEQICGEGIPIQIIQPADREIFGGGVGEWEFGVETAIYGRGMPRVSLRMKEEDWGGVVSVGLNSKKHQLNKAKKLLELTFPPRNHLEALRGNWKGYYSIRINKQNPIIHHPGKILKEEFLTLAQISPSQLAKDIGVSSKKIKEIIAEEKDLNKNIATRLALYFSTAPTF